MKKLFTLATLLLCAVASAWADETISCSAYLTATAGSTTESNATLKFYSDEGSKGSVPAGTAKDSYYYSKMNDNKNYYVLTLAQGKYTKFIAGDKITVYLFSYSTTVDYKIGKDAKKLVQKTKQTRSQIIEVPYTLTASEIESDGTIRIYRNSSNTYFAGISVSGTRVVDTASPTIDTDLNDATPYEAKVSQQTTLTIAASHADGYQWYVNTTNSTEGGEAISGAESNTYSFTPKAADTGTTKYYYCVVTNSEATSTKTITSKVATVTVGASADASVASVVVVANGKYTAAASGTNYTATIAGKETAKVTITPNDNETAVVSSGAVTGAAGKAITVDATAGTPLTFTVTAGDGTTAINYTVNITKAADKTITGNAYYIANGEQIYGGQKVIGDNITLTFSDDEAGTFAKGSSNSYVSADIDANFVASTDGNTVSGELKADGIAGTWYKFAPTLDGTLHVGAIVNKDKYLSISNGTSATAITTGITYQTYQDKKFDASWKATDKIYGIITIDVEAGKEYYFTVTGASKMGFYGFNFEVATETATIGTTKYATFVATKKVAVPADVTAYKVSATTDGKATMEEVNVISAGGAVILSGEAGNYTFTATAADADDTGNLLVASTGTGISADGTQYVLADGKQGIGFYKATSGTIAAGKAYLPASSLAGFLPFNFGNETTGIEAVEAQPAKLQGEVYNLAGQRVSQPTKGLYIVGGKKVVVK